MKIHIVLFCALVLLASCQKEISPDSLQEPEGDSVTLVKSIVVINYDEFDNFDSKISELYTYDQLLNRTVVSIVDSAATSFPAVNSFTETFQYDKQKRLVQFASTNVQAGVTNIDFTYDVPGNLTKASIQEKVLGKTLICHFKYTLSGTNKIITMYDTSHKGEVNYDIRPLVSKFTFNNSDRLIDQVEYATSSSDKAPEFWFKDTLNMKIGYDTDSTINKVMFNMAYDPAFFANFLDSSLYTNEGTNKAIYNSYINLYRNVYWFYTAETINGSFAHAMVHNSSYPHYAYYSGYPINSSKVWTSYPPFDLVFTESKQGVFQNTYDAQGLLTKAIYPPGFGSKYDGKTVIEYTYTKVKK